MDHEGSQGEVPKQNVASLSAMRRGRLGVCTRRMNELKALFVHCYDAEMMKSTVEAFYSAIEEFKETHRLVQENLPDDIREKERIDWFDPKMATFENFMKELEMWKHGHIQKDPQALIGLNDSASNVSKRSHKSHSSHCSNMSSSVSSLTIKAATDKVALLARKAALKQKHALEMEKAALNMKLETMNLECDLAANDAKLKVLENFEISASPSQQIRYAVILQSSEPKDGMNEYFGKHCIDHSKQLLTRDQTSPGTSPSSEFVQLGAIPKTPLQRILQAPKPMVSQRNYENKATTSDESIINMPNQSSSNNEVGLTNMNLSNVMQRQDKIAEPLILQQKHTLLPSREIPVFGGDPLNCYSFMQAFEYGMEEKTDNCRDRLYYLEQFTSGQSKELVQSCLHMDARRGYAEAKRLLKLNFGDEVKITSAYIEKDLSWCNIKGDDGKPLNAYALYLRGCCNAAEDLPNMFDLDLPSNLRHIISKLPYKLREKWRNTSCDLFERTHNRAKFKDVVVFIEKQSKILQDPLFGNIQDLTPVTKGPKARTEFRPTKLGSNKSFVTAISPLTLSTRNMKDVKKLKCSTADPLYVLVW
ncbi:uncharacterized protein LOC117538615 [Tachysurus ichikawai]